MDGKTFRFHDYTGTFVLLAAFSKKKNTKTQKEEGRRARLLSSKLFMMLSMSPTPSAVCTPVRACVCMRVVYCL